MTLSNMATAIDVITVRIMLPAPSLAVAANFKEGGMLVAWIELHQTLPTNKKTVRLKNLLRIKTPQAVGHLCILWLWALDNAPDGDLSGFSTEEIAEVACWTGKNHGDFVGALVQSGFIDSDMRLHDWYDYTGKLVDKRKQNAERMRRARAANVQCTDDERAGATVPYPTVPYPTVHNSTVPPNGDTSPIPPAGGGSKAEAPTPDKSPPAPEAVLDVLLPVNDGDDVRVSADQMSTWATIYPAIDVPQQVRMMRAWLLANPTRHKPTPALTRFVVGWLAKAQAQAQATAPRSGEQSPDTAANGGNPFAALARAGVDT